MIYLDNAATTVLSMMVFREMFPYLFEKYGNPGTVYRLGREAREAVDTARSRVAGFLNCDPDQVIFTAGGSDGNNLVINGLTDELSRKSRLTVVSSLAEHDSVYRTIQNRMWFLNPVFLQINSDGTIRMQDLEETLSRREIGLVSIMYVNNELDGVNDVRAIAELCHSYGALFHTDAVQAAGAHPIDVQEIGCDFLTISSHKIHGPKGVGAVYARDKSLLTPSVYGGENQEFGLRAGTENVPGIVGFGKACDMIRESEGSVSRFKPWTYLPTLKRIFMDELKACLEEAGLSDILHVNAGFDPYEPTGKTLSLRFDGVDSETMILMLDAADVCVSAGSACHGDRTKPSRVLLASGLTPEQANNTIRVSFSRLNDGSDARTGAREIVNCLKLLKGAGS